MPKLVQVSESDAEKRRVRFHLVDETDGKTPELGEAGGQPQISTNDGAYTDTGIGVLVAVGNGTYYAVLTAGAVGTVGDHIETRYKSANTAEAIGDDIDVVAYDPYGTAAAPGGVANPGATGFMTLTTARGWVRQYARNAGSSTMYPDAMIDRAIQAVGEDFCRAVKVVQVDSVDVTSGDAAVDVSGLDASFAPERMTAAYISGEADPLALIDWEEVNRLSVDEPSEGVPTKLAFEDPTTVLVYPTPDDDYTLKLRWWQAFTTWEPGVDSTTADAIHLNIRPDHLLLILADGPTSFLQHNEPEMRYASASWQRYVETRNRLKGAGSLGSKSFDRVKADW